MNNLAASFAQHPLQPLAEPPVDKTTGKATSRTPSPPSSPPTRKELLETAQRWAMNAHRQATETKGETRSAECDTACAVSLCNLGDIASSLGNIGDARRFFKEARDMSKTLGFADGRRQADEALRRLSDKP